MMADEDGLNALRERLASHSNCFDSLLELIPPKYYFDDNEEGQGKKFYKNKQNKAPKQAVKEASKKAKLSRLDPSNHKSVIELQAESSCKISERKNDEPYVSVENLECSNIGNLRVKLHERIELLKKKRKATSSVNTNTDKPSKKAKRKSKEQKNIKKVKSGLDFGKFNGKEFGNSKKLITNHDGKVVFSKFDFTTDVTKTQQSKEGKVKKKNYKKLLEDAENRKKKLQEIKVTDAEKAKEIVEEAAWKKALGKSEGLKQKDDPALLRKAIKCKENQKKKHQKKWKERNEKQKRLMKERQEIRQNNIKERIEKKKKNNMKKGGRTPGF